MNKKEPKASGEPQPPKTLSPFAQKLWARLVGSMPVGVYSVCDEGLLSAYCEAVALHAQATKALLTEPLVIVRGTGGLSVSPWISIQSDQARLMASLGARLGLDPVARQSLNHMPDEAPKADKFSGFIN